MTAIALRRIGHAARLSKRYSPATALLHGPRPPGRHPPAFPRDVRRKFWHLWGVDKLTAAEINAAVRTVPDWTRRGARLSRTFVFRDFRGAMQFVRAVARRAEQAAHHPDILIRWNKVRLTLTTHDAGGLTRKDFGLARKVDRL